MKIDFPVFYTVKDRQDFDDVSEIVRKLPVELNTQYHVHIVSKNAALGVRHMDLVVSIDAHSQRFQTLEYQDLKDKKLPQCAYYDRAVELDMDTLDKIITVNSPEAVVENNGDTRHVTFFDGDNVYRVYIDFEVLAVHQRDLDQ